MRIRQEPPRLSHSDPGSDSGPSPDLWSSRERLRTGRSTITAATYPPPEGRPRHPRGVGTRRDRASVRDTSHVDAPHVPEEVRLPRVPGLDVDGAVVPDGLTVRRRLGHGHDGDGLHGPVPVLRPSIRCRSPPPRPSTTCLSPRARTRTCGLYLLSLTHRTCLRTVPVPSSPPPRVAHPCARRVSHPCVPRTRRTRPTATDRPLPYQFLWESTVTNPTSPPRPRRRLDNLRSPPGPGRRRAPVETPWGVPAAYRGSENLVKEERKTKTRAE